MTRRNEIYLYTFEEKGGNIIRMRQYDFQFFKNTYPKWKRDMDSPFVRYFYRPISFEFSSIFCNVGLSANQVSMISMIVGWAASVCYLFHYKFMHIIGAVLLNLWMVLDCADGNIARAVKKEPFGGFVDAVSGYFVMATINLCVGIAAFFSDGIFVAKGCFLLIVAGAISSISDILARLIYQKYQNTMTKMPPIDNQGMATSTGQVSKLRAIEDKIDKTIALNGIMLPFLLIVSICKGMDLFVLFYAAFNVVKLAGTFLFLMKRANDACKSTN